ncbi:MAG: phospho-sugar mutase, partial [Muribaculaceae bacterium]|nr:phospho-sugar mutase [Muribaculaceae bacterium]
INFRANPPKTIDGSEVVLIKDYADLNMTEVKTGNIVKMDFPATSNVLQYFTEDGTKVSVRPSGTEPKIKFYIEVKGKLEKAEDYDAVKAQAEAKIERVKKDFGI